MADPAKHGVDALTEKEKQTLRLIVRGHDAKSIARTLGLSVHTINERLRDARRKLAVPSSREAARLLFDAEGGVLIPDPVMDSKIGEAPAAPSGHPEAAPAAGAGRRSRFPWPLAGVALMTPLIVLVAFAAGPQLVAPQATADDAPKPAVVEAARQFLTLIDGSRWAESYRLTGAAFQKQNTLAVWTATSEMVRAQFGAAGARTFLSEEELPAPPAGYQVVKFRTDYANKAGAVETVSLAYEGGVWRIAGITIG